MHPSISFESDTLYLNIITYVHSTCIQVLALVCHSWKPTEASEEGQCFLYLSGAVIIFARFPSNCNHGRLGHRE
jgi:hypothetical protein